MNWSNRCIQGLVGTKKVSLHNTLTLLVLCITSLSVYSQDTTQVQSTPIAIEVETSDPLDSAAMAKLAKRFNPQKALLYSAVLPGAGQVYNKKYWKVPIVYGGFVFLGYFIDAYNDNYLFYKNELFKELNEKGSSSTGFTETDLRSYTDQYRRERDLFMVLTGLWYMLQIIDAHVDSHLKEFDVNPNLNVRIEPSFKQDMLLGRQSGFSVTLRF
jgi:hypothetical protein